ncbi:hypothetical protein PHYBLDRAFT_71525 [Phycomyces blakesleeanus NRRL 1555(-)]|uniref:Uncharacterized protein n=1 Tax=Phycomyces blakesleeanus (strain ATCC 8743b / DSM 1359 / FGSC 10004 / NBRC 33097 / NRRL 1555) TaxID=763407 RepID=A0A162PLN3_PHYB8|nr:hypothetical protein PHYBLDRAFT_71525 [Phycomyces blakesleeanus NRRL 1555(-)]OAD70086.1 hypothetical protein PHYBLDRAFT_71525 [Phycomyces blakesleeanus NRRL 1555(-)]|eukprot:XP_018288126.1 hypothetical protein PHYBLDRAFT_71525 [Phycomyces blakesleeanus NRRL 1555(-)]
MAASKWPTSFKRLRWLLLSLKAKLDTLRLTFKPQNKLNILAEERVVHIPNTFPKTLVRQTDLGDDMMISCNVCFSTIIFYDLVLMFLVLLARVSVFVLAGLKGIVKLRARTRDGKPAATQKIKNSKIQNKSKKESLDLVNATKEIGFKRPAIAQEDYQYDYCTSVGKRVVWFWALTHLIYKDQEKFPLVKMYMLATLPKYSHIYASTFRTNGKQLEDIIEHGSDLCITNSNSNTNFISACLDVSM